MLHEIWEHFPTLHMNPYSNHNANAGNNTHLYIYTSRGTRRCPGWRMAKPDSNFVYYITKKGGWNKLWKCIRVKYAPCYIWKGPQLTQNHTHARRRQHRELIQCLLRELRGKQRHVTKLECYRLFEMSLKFFVFPSGAGMQMFVGFPTFEHATYICPCEKHGSQCCLAVHKTFPRRDETGWEGRRRYINTGASDTDTHVTLRVGSTVLSSR